MDRREACTKVVPRASLARSLSRAISRSLSRVRPLSPSPTLSSCVLVLNPLLISSNTFWMESSAWSSCLHNRHFVLERGRGSETERKRGQKGSRRRYDATKLARSSVACPLPTCRPCITGVGRIRLPLSFCFPALNTVCTDESSRGDVASSGCTERGFTRASRVVGVASSSFIAGGEPAVCRGKCAGGQLPFAPPAALRARSLFREPRHGAGLCVCVCVCVCIFVSVSVCVCEREARPGHSRPFCLCVLGVYPSLSF